jgi:3-isopropylmalate dehydrogenase
MRVVLLPGDGVGPEVMDAGRKVLSAVAPDLELVEAEIGASAIRRHGDPLPRCTLEACLRSDAVLMGAVGAAGHRWSGRSPEEGMFELRRALDAYANVRPFTGSGFDLVIVRELVGGLYYGQRGVRPDGVVYDTCEYHPAQIERVVRKALALARTRRGRLTSVDKANVLETSRLWREIADRLGTEHADVELSHVLVDTAAMRLVTEPGAFDVIVTENTFGDILSDVAAGVAGGLGVAPSASLGDHAPGLFEPVHGSAPDIAGQDIANPTAMLRTVALMLEHGLGRIADAARLTAAVDRTAAAHRTRDQGGDVGTTAFARVVLRELAGT